MLIDKYTELELLAGPNDYVAPATDDDLAYLSYFRQVCNRYNIVFKDADQDEREFVIRMAEKGFYENSAQPRNRK